MEFNGTPVEKIFAEKMKEWNETANQITPEQEADFKKREHDRLHKEGLDRVSNSNAISNLPKRYQSAMFDNYPSEITETARELCLKENSDTIYLLFGSTGCGKTTTFACAVHERAYVGLGGSYYFTIRDLEAKLRMLRDFKTEDTEEAFLKHLTTVPFLCIDEIGTCPNIQEERNFLSYIISARFDNMLPLWMATNLTPIQFKGFLCNVDFSNKTVGEQKTLSAELDKTNVIMNRIKSVAVVNVLNGESFRGVQNADRNNAE